MSTGQLATLEAAYRETRAALTACGVPDAAFDAAQLVRAACGRDWRTAPDTTLAPDCAALLRALTARRSAREPLQYILGQWDFLDFTLRVGPGVLIPRADTECVCEAAIAAARRWEKPVVLDLCSGSGALAIGVSRAVPAAAVTAVELSEDAFCYLRENVAALAPAVRCLRADVLGAEALFAAGTVRVVVCNPPYVTCGEMKALAPELRHEPEMALCDGGDGLRFYRYLARHYRTCMASGGTLVLEIGAAQADAVTRLLREADWEDITVQDDAAGLPRCVCASRA